MCGAWTSSHRLTVTQRYPSTEISTLFIMIHTMSQCYDFPTHYAILFSYGKKSQNIWLTYLVVCHQEHSNYISSEMNNALGVWLECLSLHDSRLDTPVTVVMGTWEGEVGLSVPTSDNITARTQQMCGKKLLTFLGVSGNVYSAYWDSVKWRLRETSGTV
jgi:hypothetical protein